jgi:hypothetical protein
MNTLTIAKNPKLATEEREKERKTGLGQDMADFLGLKVADHIFRVCRLSAYEMLGYG